MKKKPNLFARDIHTYRPAEIRQSNIKDWKVGEMGIIVPCDYTPFVGKASDWSLKNQLAVGTPLRPVDPHIAENPDELDLSKIETVLSNEQIVSE